MCVLFFPPYTQKATDAALRQKLDYLHNEQQVRICDKEEGH